MKVPRDSSTGLWTIDLKKESHVRLNNIQELKSNRAPYITPVPTSKNRSNVSIAWNTKVQLTRFYNKAAFSPSISTSIKSISAGHIKTCTNLTSNIIQKFSQKAQQQVKSTWIKFNITSSQLRTLKLHNTQSSIKILIVN